MRIVQFAIVACLAFVTLPACAGNTPPTLEETRALDEKLLAKQPVKLQGQAVVCMERPQIMRIVDVDIGESTQSELKKIARTDGCMRFSSSSYFMLHEPVAFGVKLYVDSFGRHHSFPYCVLRVAIRGDALVGHAKKLQMREIDSGFMIITIKSGLVYRKCQLFDT